MFGFTDLSQIEKAAAHLLWRTASEPYDAVVSDMVDLAAATYELIGKRADEDTFEFIKRVGDDTREASFAVLADTLEFARENGREDTTEIAGLQLTIIADEEAAR